MELSLAGRAALVCGATQGIGRACAAELAALGAHVTLLARTASALEEAASTLPSPGGHEHRWLVADLSDLAMVRRVIEAELRERPGGFHVLVNNTGGPAGGRAIDAAPDAYLAAFSAHLVAAQVLASALVPGMRRAGYGRIINILSTSVKAPIPGLGVSNTIRAAVAQWAKTLAHELGPDGITVNNVLPGYTQTERLNTLMHARAAAAGVAPEKIANDWRAAIPLGRFGRAEEIGAAVAFLASPAASYISGINLPVDGGRSPGL